MVSRASKPPIKGPLINALRGLVYRSKGAGRLRVCGDREKSRSDMEFIRAAQVRTLAMSVGRQPTPLEVSNLIERTIAIVTDDSGALALLRVRQRPSAYILLQHAGDVVFVYDIFVGASMRRRGVASFLLSAALQLCRVTQARGVVLDVARRNRPALMMYAAHGLRRIRTYSRQGVNRDRLILRTACLPAAPRIDSIYNLCFYSFRLTKEDVMAETESKRRAREALERAKTEADKALKKLEAGQLNDDQDLERLSKSASQFFDVNGVC